MVYSSAWVKVESIYDYAENKNKFSIKNKTKKFQEAIQQANEAAEREKPNSINSTPCETIQQDNEPDESEHQNNSNESTPCEAIEQTNKPSEREKRNSTDSTPCPAAAIDNNNKISLQTMAIDDLLKTYDDHKTMLQLIFNEKRTILNSQIYNAEYDFLLVVSRLATSEQHQNMYTHMTDKLAGENYFEYRHLENLFWNILLPEWLIAICARALSKTKKQILEQIEIDEQQSFEANNSFEL